MRVGTCSEQEIADREHGPHLGGGAFIYPCLGEDSGMKGNIPDGLIFLSQERGLLSGYEAQGRIP